MNASSPQFVPVVVAVLLGTASAQGDLPPLRFSMQSLSSATEPDPPGVRDLALIQLDFTGPSDIVHLAGGTLEILFNPVRGAVSSRAQYAVDSNPRGFVTGDFDGDRLRDIAVLGFAGARIELLFGTGRGAFTRRATVPAGPDPTALAAGDFDRDGRMDLAYTYAVDADHDSVRTLLNRGEGRFETGVDRPVGKWVTAMTADDLDGDGSPDLAITSFLDVVMVLLSNGGGGWHTTAAYRMADRPVAIDAADLNRDGLRDLVTANFDSQTIGVLLGRGGGTFAAARQFPMERAFTGRLTPTRLALGDLTEDGVIDVMLANGSLLPGRGDGTFAPPMQFDMSAGTVAVADLNGDGRADVVADHDFTSAPRVVVGLNRALGTNHAPVPPVVADAVVPFGEDGFFDARRATDADGHLVLYEWRDELGRVVGTVPSEAVRRLPGRYVYTLSLRDTFGAETLVHPTLTVTGTAPPFTDIVLHAARARTIRGTWRLVPDSTAASGARLHQPDRGAERPASPLARPASYFELRFRANPERTYTLSMRARADGNNWRNDSVFVQFSDAVGAESEQRWRIGTTEGLVYSLERCTSCGMSGWGWNFDGVPNRTNIGEAIRFNTDGWQTIRIQSREDGISIDQIVLSSWTYQGGRHPGAAKRDTIVLPKTQ